MNKLALISLLLPLALPFLAKANDFLVPARQALALEKLSTISVPTDLQRTSESVFESKALCRSRNEKIVSIDPNSKEPMEVLLKSYYSLSASRTVIVLPPTGGVNTLDYKYAQALCDSGLNAIILLTWQGDNIQLVDTGMHDQNALRGVTAIRSLLSTIDESQKVGIFGTSVGGIMGALSIGLEERLTVGLFVVAGGGMTEIIAQSTEDTLTSLRELRTKEYNFSDISDYYQLLDESVVIEPLDFAGYSGEKKIGFILSKADSTVPTKNQYDLINAWGGEKLIFKKGPPLFNHFATILHSSQWWTDDVVSYFLENL